MQDIDKTIDIFEIFLGNDNSARRVIDEYKIIFDTCKNIPGMFACMSREMANLLRDASFFVMKSTRSRAVHSFLLRASLTIKGTSIDDAIDNLNPKLLSEQDIDAIMSVADPDALSSRIHDMNEKMIREIAMARFIDGGDISDIVLSLKTCSSMTDDSINEIEMMKKKHA